MFWRTRLAVAVSLILGGVSGGIAVTIAIVGIPGPAQLRGGILGLTGGLFGVCLFAAGLLFGRLETLQSHHKLIPPRARKPAVSPAEAKFWLQRFLEEHQPPAAKK